MYSKLCPGKKHKEAVAVIPGIGHNFSVQYGRSFEV